MPSRAPSLESTSGVSDRADAQAVDRGAKRLAAGDAVSSLEKGGSEPISEHAGDSLQQEDPSPGEEAGQLPRAVGAGDRLPDLLHDRLRHSGCRGVELGDEFSNYAEHLAKAYAHADSVGDE